MSYHAYVYTISVMFDYSRTRLRCLLIALIRCRLRRYDAFRLFDADVAYADILLLPRRSVCCACAMPRRVATNGRLVRTRAFDAHYARGARRWPILLF